MQDCWAASIGGCGGGITGEHLVSAAVWDGSPIDVIGFHWCKDKPEQIGSANLTAHILCANHNSRLSPTDDEARRGTVAIRQIVELGNARFGQSPTDWPVQNFAIDGFVFERWLVKTAINLCCAADPSITWPTGQPAVDPPELLVRAAFGLGPLSAPAGMYGVAATSERIYFRERVEFAPIFHLGGLIAGVFNFHGTRFLINLSQHALPNQLDLPLAFGSRLLPSELLYHLARIDYSVGPRLSHHLRFFPDRASNAAAI